MLLIGDALTHLKNLPAGSAHCCVTSPPYWGLRDYGVDGQLGLEKTPDEFVAKMVELFREVRRTLRDDGTLWVNIGDSYVSSGGAGWQGKHGTQRANRTHTQRRLLGDTRGHGLKAKDLAGIPWLLAFALRADGWWLRQDIIWSKPNPMPESVRDRCTKAHEYIFLLSKSSQYYFDLDAIREKATWKDKGAPFGWATGSGSHSSVEHQKAGKHRKSQPKGSFAGKTGTKAFRKTGEWRNKRSVWRVASQPFKGAHFATFPPKLIEPCILAGCPVGGTVIDPFFGAGTTGLVAAKFGRQFIGIELNPEYARLAEERIRGTQMVLAGAEGA